MERTQEYRDKMLDQDQSYQNKDTDQDQELSRELERLRDNINRVMSIINRY